MAFTLVLVLLVSLVAGLARVLRGPVPGDRMLAAQLFGTTGVAILLLLGEALASPSLRNVALVIVLLALVNVAMFVRRGRPHVRAGGPAGAPETP